MPVHPLASVLGPLATLTSATEPSPVPAPR